MERLFQSFQEYYRHKRILHIKFIRFQIDYDLELNHAPPAWTRLLIHIFILASLGLVLGGGLSFLLSNLEAFLPAFLSIGIVFIFQLFNGWLSVEITDYIWLKHPETIQTVARVVSLLFIFLFAIALSILLQHKGTSSLSQYLINWHTQTNQTLQRNSAASVQINGVAEGTNWSFLRNSSGRLEPMIQTEAKRFCGDRLGNGWQLPTAKQLKTLHPHPKLSRNIYVWTINEQENLVLTTLAQTSNQSGSSFVSHKSTNFFPTLCYKEKK
ncbi:MAG TPA: hypothetical protein V6D19_14725 [Stenomitos sp.]